MPPEVIFFLGASRLVDAAWPRCSLASLAKKKIIITSGTQGRQHFVQIRVRAYYQNCMVFYFASQVHVMMAFHCSQFLTDTRADSNQWSLISTTETGSS